MRFTLIIYFLVGWTVSLFAQEPVEAETAGADKWSFETSIYYYSFPDLEDNLMPILYSDYRNFHFEVRYNYEDKKTFSFFGGYRFEGGEKTEWGITPILGAVTGNSEGIAPGLELDFAFNKIDFYSESEWFVDLSEKENNFIYTWSELGFLATEKIRCGISANRTKIYDTKREIQHGVFGEYSFNSLTAGVHYFNPISDYFFIFTLNYIIPN